MDISKQNNYITWLKDIKSKIYTLQIKSAIAVNTNMLAFYWDLGKSIAQK